MDILLLVGRVLFASIFLISGIMLGVFGDVGAILIVGFLVGITPIMHAFWNERDQQMRRIQFAMFTKNISMLGGALILFWIFNQGQGEVPFTLTDPLIGRW